MSELKAIRLSKAATTYNVGSDHIIEELKRNGFTVESNPNAKLLPEMVAVLDRAFNKDKEIISLLSYSITETHNNNCGFFCIFVLYKNVYLWKFQIL